MTSDREQRWRHICRLHHERLTAQFHGLADLEAAIGRVLTHEVAAYRELYGDAPPRRSQLEEVVARATKLRRSGRAPSMRVALERAADEVREQ